MRYEEELILMVGRAIANDYLGLIDLKMNHKEEARMRFEQCRQLAASAMGMIVMSAETLEAADRDRRMIQPDVWFQIAMDNRARALDYPDAVAAFKEAMVSRLQAIEKEQETIADVTLAESLADDYLIAHWPQLWLRASELMKKLFDCEGNTDRRGVPGEIWPMSTKSSLTGRSRFLSEPFRLEQPIITPEPAVSCQF